jgi:hypothetical protein
MAKLKEQIVIKSEFSVLKIFIDETLHLYLDKDKLLGIQSWISNDKYLIEYTLIGNTITTEYNSHEKWVFILNLLNENL